MEAFLCFQCGRTLTRSEHKAPRNTKGRLADISVQQLMLQQIHKLSHICFADVDPEVNVQIMD